MKKSINYEACFIQIYSGAAFRYDTESMDAISIYDIANSLSQQNRFAGHTKFTYSVAQHCVLLATALEKTGYKKFSYIGLMHDAHESVIPDIPKPLKNRLGVEFGIDFYEQFELKIQKMFEKKFNYHVNATVYNYDLRMIVNEKNRLMKKSKLDWQINGVSALPIKIRKWTAKQAKFRFLAKYFKLIGNLSDDKMFEHKMKLKSLMYYLIGFFV